MARRVPPAPRMFKFDNSVSGDKFDKFDNSGSSDKMQIIAYLYRCQVLCHLLRATFRSYVEFRRLNDGVVKAERPASLGSR